LRPALLAGEEPGFSVLQLSRPAIDPTFRPFQPLVCPFESRSRPRHPSLGALFVKNQPQLKLAGRDHRCLLLFLVLALRHEWSLLYARCA
jgi:hypothetical protein